MPTDPRILVTLKAFTQPFQDACRRAKADLDQFALSTQKPIDVMERLLRFLTPEEFEALSVRINAMPPWQRKDAQVVALTLAQGGMKITDIINPGLDICLDLIQGHLRMEAVHAAEAVACVCAVANLSGPHIRLARNVVEVCCEG